MMLPEFELHVPTRLEEALAILRDEGARAAAMAGGTDLMVLMKQGAVSPAVIVSLTRVREIQGVRRENGAVWIGGGTSVAAIESSGLLARHARGLVDSAARMATAQIRNVATVAGNLASAAACGDLAPVLAALDAKVALRSASRARELPLADFFTDARRTVLEPGELITAIEIPAAGSGSGSAFVKFGYRCGAQVAVVSAAASVAQEHGRVRRVRLVLGAAAPVPLVVQGVSALVGQAMDGAALDAACAAAASECRPISDIRGSESYRRAVASVVARRALTLAWERSRGHGA